ncbi:LytTR family DNA-binding domain-containing protein [Pararhodobacter sp. SW119]|uniref:LytTR family DNA-binding domain-containing protein n=1 Tax=Pararhodobacter sp. SW119 TaxID=2780075 RepID=UPI001ADF38FC|nr:LytTR family DNA-binding domain-containing protein [Pararhodobacter sp. SW119]
MGQRLAGPVVLGAVLGLIGPFGTYEMLPTLPRLTYWLAIVALNWLLCDIAIRRVDDVVPEDISLRRILVPLFGAVLVSLPATGVVAIAGGVSGIGWPESILSLYWKVALLLVAISLPVYTFADLREVAESAARSPGSAPQDTGESGEAATGLALFLARLARPLEGRLLCLEMQDHYLVVHTTEGSDLILCRMEDAARELGALGLRVHRSWWVAANAVEAVERDGQRLMLRLSDDRRVPVGRTYRESLKTEGWLG